MPSRGARGALLAMADTEFDAGRGVAEVAASRIFEAGWKIGPPTPTFNARKDLLLMDRDPSRRAWLLASITPVFALALFRPWIRGAFPVWDYPDVLGVLRSAPGVLNGATAIAVWNRPTGRANYLTFAHLSASWNLVGADSVGWQVIRALVMLLAAVLFIQVGRRLGASPLAAAVAAGIWIVAVPSTEGWILLAAEQLGTVFLLLTVLAAAGYTTTRAWRGRAVLIAVLCACVMLSKEIMGFCLPMVVILAVCWDADRGWRLPAVGPRERWLGLLLLVVVVLEGWSVRTTMLDATPGNYASLFGRNGFDADRAVGLFQAMLFPARFTSGGAATILYPANLAFLVLLTLGLLVGIRAVRHSQGGVWMLWLLSFPVVGALVYGFWPRYSSYYGLPVFTGSAGLLALAATGIAQRGTRGRVAVTVLGGATILFTALASARVIRHRQATANLAVRVTSLLPTRPRLDTLLVVTPAQGMRQWPVNASELRSYAIFMEVPDSLIPVIQDASCEEVVRRLQRPLGRTAVLNDQNPCGRLPQATVVWTEDLGYLDWTTWRAVPVTMRVELLAPSWPPSGR